MNLTTEIKTHTAHLWDGDKVLVPLQVSLMLDDKDIPSDHVFVIGEDKFRKSLIKRITKNKDGLKKHQREKLEEKQWKKNLDKQKEDFRIWEKDHKEEFAEALELATKMIKNNEDGTWSRFDKFKLTTQKAIIEAKARILCGIEIKTNF